jgi:hypothetical protein
MDIDTICDDDRFRELIAAFPLTPIEDDRSYCAAIKILDDIFTRDNKQTAGERKYFQALALISCQYEESTGTQSTSAPLGSCSAVIESKEPPSRRSPPLHSRSASCVVSPTRKEV